MNGMFVNGIRKSAVIVNEDVTIHLGDPVEGPAVAFDLVAMPSGSEEATTVVRGSGALPGEDDEDTALLDPGVVRAGAAAAARRRELDISQRSLAADGIINAGALIAFEKGRSWPRERTRTRLEEVLRWPPGTIAGLRRGGSVEPEEKTEILPGSDEVPLIAQAVVTGLHALSGVIDELPPVDDPNFTPRATAVLADLRQLEGVASRATRISKVTPPLITALSAVRRRINDVALLSATAPGATLGQRLYAARRRANLTILETAQAAGVSEDTIVRIEDEEPVSAVDVSAVEAVLRAIG
jgi:transcriptional regulator with XRE-family HTH domain